jgi:hemolysin III
MVLKWRMQKFRDPASGLTHLAAASAAAAGTAGLLWAGRGQSTKEIAFLIYGISLILMFSASATYHLVQGGPKAIGILRKIDHSAIYLLIAGTYTPICLIFFTGFWREGLLGIIWAFALIGVGVKVFVINAPRWVTTGIYLAMGWLAVMGVTEIVKTMPAGAIFWLVAGGLWFTAGAVIYILKKPDPRPGVFGFHEIWHIFVILGCLSHFILVAGYVAPL